MRARVHFGRIPGSAGERPKIARAKSEMCYRCGKLAYVSKKIAAQKAAVARSASGENVVAYHSKPCHCWHIGHPPGTR